MAGSRDGKKLLRQPGVYAAKCSMPMQARTPRLHAGGLQNLELQDEPQTIQLACMLPTQEAMLKWSRPRTPA